MRACESKPAAGYGGPETTALIKTTGRAGYADVGMVKDITQPHNSYSECACLSVSKCMYLCVTFQRTSSDSFSSACC